MRINGTLRQGGESFLNNKLEQLRTLGISWQKFSSRINATLLEKIISSFILLLVNIRKLFTGIDSTGFKITHASQYYAERTGTRRNLRNYLLELMSYNKSYVQLR